MTALTDSMIITDKKWCMGLCDDSYKAHHRTTMCVSTRRLKQILEAFEDNDQVYVYLHIDECKGTGGYYKVLRMSTRKEDDCNQIALARFYVKDEDIMKVEYNNSLLHEIAMDLDFDEYDKPEE